MLLRVLPSTLSRCLRPVSRSYYVDQLSLGEPFHPVPNRHPVTMEAEKVFEQHLDSNQKVFVHGGAATPNHLIDSMVQVGLKRKLKNISVMHIHTEGPAAYNTEACQGVFRSNSLFTSANCREAIGAGRGDFTPIFLSEIPLLFRRGAVKLDLALIMVTPPDRHGFCSLGPSVDCARSAIQNARVIVAQMQQPLHEMPPKKINPQEQRIGQLIAEKLVADGSTLQTGIGSIPDAVLASLKGHKNLGVHTEMFSDGVVDLTECGAVTNALKRIRPGKIVSGFVIGTKKVFDFIDENAMVELCDIHFVNKVAIISQNPRVTAINSCIEIDLTGQVVSDSIGPRIYSGVGGQIDFMRGAALSSDGLGVPIIALQSSTKKGGSKIVPFIREGAGVVTTRAHVHYVVTEHGIAHLWGKNLRQRAHHLINIAHPDHRESLEKAAFKRLRCMPSAD
uniref:Acetyl-CoA hydrolase n=1 Tax=Macrostomum lignano TaxID=282301 RepID=A0A1I8INC2_9PLAT